MVLVMDALHCHKKIVTYLLDKNSQTLWYDMIKKSKIYK